MTWTDSFFFSFELGLALNITISGKEMFSCEEKLFIWICITRYPQSESSGQASMHAASADKMVSLLGGEQLGPVFTRTQHRKRLLVEHKWRLGSVDALRMKNFGADCVAYLLSPHLPQSPHFLLCI
jgi:hypothetical protein